MKREHLKIEQRKIISKMLSKEAKLIEIAKILIEDDEADVMAADMLIPREEWERFISYKNYTKTSIIDFANKIGIHPCIVLGRLHKEKEVPYNQFNKIFNLKYQIIIDN